MEWVKHTKKGVICQEEKTIEEKNHKIWGAFSREPGETGTKSFWSGIRVTKDRTFILSSRQKGVFTHYSRMRKAWHREREEGDWEGRKGSPRITNSNQAYFNKVLGRVLQEGRGI